MSKSRTLTKDFDFYLEHQEELVEQYDGKVIVIKNGQVLGAYDTDGEAVVETQKNHELGTFLVQPVSLGPDAYTYKFHRTRT